MYFPPKKDIWLGIAVWSVTLASILIVTLNKSAWPALIVVIPLVLFVGSLWFGAGYTITNELLEIRCGPFHEKIPFSKIQRIKRTRKFWSSAALSYDRLEIKYSYGIIFISPLDFSTFISELKQRCPEAEFSG